MVFIAIKFDFVNEKQGLVCFGLVLGFCSVLFCFALNRSPGCTAVGRGGDELLSASLLLEQSGVRGLRPMCLFLHSLSFKNSFLL